MLFSHFQKIITIATVLETWIHELHLAPFIRETRHLKSEQPCRLGLESRGAVGCSIAEGSDPKQDDRLTNTA